MLNNAIVVMFDSLQFNYLGCYGNEWIKTPNMDRLAREGVLFENCFTESLPTVPCRRSMHTGCYNLHEAGWSPLRMGDTTIADLCWGRPIDTAIIFDCPMYRLPKFGYTRGFDKVYFTHGHELDHYFYGGDALYHGNPEDYIEDHIKKNTESVFQEDLATPLLEELGSYLRQTQYWRSDEDRYVAKTIKKAVEYLEQIDRNKQFFLWIDSFDPHEPWNPPSVYLDFPCPYNPDYKGKDQFLPLLGLCKDIYTEPELNHIRMLYAELVTLCDKWLGYLLDNMRALGLEENTLIMMVSDHGEPMGNGEHGHGIMRKCRPWPYEELVHTPMLLRAPGIKAGQRIPALVQSCDVAPTVCEWLGIGVHPGMTGKSLLPLCRGEVKKVRDFAIAGYFAFSWAMMTEEWSFIHWLKDTSDKITVLDEAYINADGGTMQGFVGDSSALKGGIPKSNDKNSILSPEEAKMRKAAPLDGQDQWTCTPGSIAEVPDGDELYDRKKDPFQLHNIISKHPDVAKKLLNELMAFMGDLPKIQ